MNYFLNDPHTRAWILKICLILFNLLRKLPQSIDSKLNKYCQNVVVFLFKKTVLPRIVEIKKLTTTILKYVWAGI